MYKYIRFKLHLTNNAMQYPGYKIYTINDVYLQITTYLINMNMNFF